ncbi:hypothetical protein K8O68_10420 [Salipaludibacillus sp. CUR1]|uniref:hypothetical protein n=1 Tax=Salipaludibacillus sp. CUR1 TaxID=2820003 RepID=UPI001E2E0444|nr:hypothetical protein [Salipaludibacillus sp. CUR1]MCE7792829.1 hypothetical protein [Salipaludibacillus sp. CUR1]
MRRLNRKHMSWSLIICLIVPFFIPSKFFFEGIGSYTYGFPLKYITIYQQEPTSAWFFGNFFNGNAGLHINPAALLLNAFIIYLIVRLAVTNIKKKKDAGSIVQ